jgi:chloramphenicol 3-O-phosphotransferase
MAASDGTMSGAVIVITGVMAAGKSPVARLLAARLPRSAHVAGDLFRRMIVSGREELLPDETAEARAQLTLRYRISAMVADTYAGAGWTAIVQDVILGLDLAEYVGHVRTSPLYVVVLAPSREAVAAREAERAKVGYGAWSVNDLDRSLRLETPRIGLWLDTSDQTADETADAVVAGLPAALIPRGPGA